MEGVNRFASWSKLIWEELEFHKDNFTIDAGSENRGVALDKNNKPIAKLKRIYLDEIYTDNRQASNILNVYSKIISSNVKEAYRNTTPSWRTFEITNKDCSLVSYYENQQDYKEHFDMFMHSCLEIFRDATSYELSPAYFTLFFNT